MRSSFASVRPIALSVSFLALTAASGSAQTPAPASGKSPEDWHFVAGLYGWFPMITGTATVRGNVQVPIDVTFSELWDHLKMNLTGHFEAQKGPFGFGVDAFYVRLATPIEGEIPELLDASINLRQFIGETFGFYRLVQGSGENPWSLQLLGGARIWNTNTRVETDVFDTDGKTLTWADGFGGLRLEIPLGSRFILLGRGDAGAGGAKLDWSASGDLAFRLGKGFVSGAGYRTLQVDYDKQDVLLTRRVFDIAYSGPRIWIVYSW